jgi:hypothetical protein
MLSSVYYKTPEQFVKRIRESLNERVDLETEDHQGDAEQQEYIDSTGVKKSEYIKNAAADIDHDYQTYFAGQDGGNLLDMEDTVIVPNTQNENAINDLLGGISGTSTVGSTATANSGESVGGGTLLDMMSDRPAQKQHDGQSVTNLLDDLSLGGSTAASTSSYCDIPHRVVV